MAWGLSVLIWLLPSNSFALGLGDIELHSALNQPFDADIELLSVGSTNQEEITVELGSGDAFSRAGLDRFLILTKFKFNVTEAPDGKLFIKVSSDESIREPFLDFLIEINWPKGRLMREYTVLIDPPVFINEKPAAIAAPMTGDADTSGGVMDDTATPMVPEQSMDTAEQIISEPVTEAPPAPANRVSSSGELQYGPVRRADTLWTIASNMRPDKTVSVQQIMMALLRNNPEAFYNNNINDLKAGYVLRIDDPGVITAMSQAEAERAAKLQYEAWQDTKRSMAANAGKRPLGAEAIQTSSPGAVGMGEGDARLKLVAADSQESSDIPTGAFASSTGVADVAELERLRNELAMALESSDATRQENAELRERLVALESQLASMERLVTLKDDTMAAMQSQAAQPDMQQPAMPEPIMPGTEVHPFPDEELSEPVLGVPDSAQSGAEMTPEIPVEQTLPQPAVSAAIPPPPPEAPAALTTPFDSLLQDPLVLGMAAGVLLLLIALVWMNIRRRRLAEEGFDEGIFAGEQASDVVDEKDEFTSVTDEYSAAGTADIDNFSATSGMDAFDADSDELDALAEADVYLAYRRFDKAEELLNEAIEQDPERHELTLKLLEVHSSSENVDSFVTVAEKLYADLGTEEASPVWNKVAAMGKKLVPDHPLFDGDIIGDASPTGEGIDVDIAEGQQDAMMEKQGLSSQDDDDLSIPTIDEFSFTEDQDDDSQDTNEQKTTEDQAADDSDIASYSIDEFDEDMSEKLSLDNELSDQKEAEPLEVSAQADDAEVDEVLSASAEVGSSESEDNSLDFESGLGSSLSFDSEEENAATNVDGESIEENSLDFDLDAIGDTAEDAAEDSSAKQESTEETAQDENTLEFDTETLKDGFSDLEDTVISKDLSSDEISLEELSDEVVDAEKVSAKNDDTTESDLGIDDDIDWLANISDDITDDEALDSALDDDSFNSAEDEIDTKLDLAKAYIDMEDKDSARGILDEVVENGSDDQKKEAQELISQLG